MLTVHPTASVQNAILQDYKSSYGINSKHEIIAEWNLNAYLDVKQYGVIAPDNSIIESGQHYKFYDISGSAAAGVDIDYERMDATPLYSIFDYKTTDSNIYGIISGVSNSTVSLTTSSMSLKNLNPSYPRFYPISKNSTNKFWSSSRIIKNADNLSTKTVGITNSSGDITYADVFIQYSSSAKINKIKIRTQYYLAFPSKFRVYTTTSTASTIPSASWTEIYSYTGAEASSTLSDGDLELYYNGSSWVIPDDYTKYTTDLSISGTQTQTITGIRLKIEKMYSSLDYSKYITKGIDAQILEISPRIICDISPYTKSFDINSSISESELGLPVGGLVSSNGTITLSNVDKYFYINQSLSIVDNYLYPNVKFSISSIINKNSQDIRIPIKTVYANSWEEDDENFEVSVQIEDFMKFFKSTPSPDIIFANKRGVPSSIAILSLLDNVGYGKYQFSKTSVGALNEDPTMQFFFARKENTLAQTLEEIAVSCQLSMFIDAKNNFVVMTKERVCNAIPNDSVNWWFVGDPQNAINGTDPEYSYISSGSYISNISSFSKKLEYPVTDMQVEYSGLGIQKSPQFLSAFAEASKLDSVTKGDISLLSSDSNYVLDPVWRASDNDEENNIFSTVLIKKIDSTVPSSIQDLSASPFKINAENEYDAIRKFYNSLSLADKTKLEIVFDDLSMQLIGKNKSYSGYFMIDNEVIRYKGIKYNVFLNSVNVGASILFNDAERIQLESQQGTSVSPNALILYLDFDIENESASSVFISSTLKSYVLKSHGRAATTYKTSAPMEEHIPSSGISSRWSKINTIKLFDTTTKTNAAQASYNKNFKSQTSQQFYVPGNLALTGLSFNLGSSSITSGSINGFPVLYQVEKFISGLGISSSIGYNVLSTRFRLISKSSDSIDYQSGNAGIFFGLKNDGGNATGYFVELISFGGVSGERLKDADFENLYLYKITASADGQLYPEILGGGTAKRVVTAARVPETSYYNLYNTESKAIVSDLKVVISANKIKVYWEDQLAISVNRENTSRDKDIFKGTTKSGVFLRGNTKAIFDYFLATSENDNALLSDYGMYNESINPVNSDLYTAAKNKTVSAQSLSQNILLNSKTKSTFYDDFGKTCREIKKFSARFNAPVLHPQMLEYGSNLGRYKVTDFKSTGFGAEFWIVNCCSDTLKLGEDSSIPLIIAGYTIKKSTNENLIVSIDDLIKANENEYNTDMTTSKMLPVFLNIQKNKEKYGANSLSIQSEFISSYREAFSLANWVLKNKSSEKISININCFANPLLEIGDKVKLFYKDKGFCQKIFGEKSFVISSIGYSVEEGGPTMSIELRELSNG